jgi:hypothetical protein
MERVVSMRRPPTLTGAGLRCVRHMTQTMRDALGTIMTVHNVERLIELSQEDCLVNVELLSRVIDRSPPIGPNGIVHWRATLWTVLTQDRVPEEGLPIVNCIYDGGQGVFANDNRFVKLCDLLAWLDRIGEEKELTKHRDLAIRIAAALRFVIWYSTHNVLLEATTQLADAKDELEEARMELLECQRERVKLLREHLETTKRTLEATPEEPTPEEPPAKKSK